MSANPAFKMSNSVLNAKIVSSKKQGKEKLCTNLSWKLKTSQSQKIVAY